MNQPSSQSEIQRRFASFRSDRKVNREFYEKVSEELFDYRMVDTAERKSDSPRESLAHQIRVQREYMRAIQAGKLEFGHGPFENGALSGIKGGLG